MSIYKQLKELNLISWPTLLIGFEKELISKKDIEDYAILLLNVPNFFEENIALLANASNYSDYEVEDMLMKQSDLKTIVKKDEIDKLKLASLLFIEKSIISDREKCDKLQELYANFDYPEDLSNCSIYSINADSPLDSMHNLIISLKNQLIPTKAGSMD